MYKVLTHALNYCSVHDILYFDFLVAITLWFSSRPYCLKTEYIRPMQVSSPYNSYDIIKLDSK